MMPFYRINGAIVHIKFGGKKRPPAPCVAPIGVDAARCCGISQFLCDWPLSDGKTCDAPLCPVHAHEVGKNRHYCHIHHAQHLHQQPQLALFTELAR